MDIYIVHLIFVQQIYITNKIYAYLTTIRSKNYPDSSLADLYDPLLMPQDLRKAHEANDKAVLEAYGLKASASDNEIMAKLLKMYQDLVQTRD